jgi:hypothetical protein
MKDDLFLICLHDAHGGVDAREMERACAARRRVILSL